MFIAAESQATVADGWACVALIVICLIGIYLVLQSMKSKN